MHRLLTILFLISTIICNLFGQIINLAAIRVEFNEDSNALTTGNGLFAIDSVTLDSFAVDPAPHNRAYFQDQITAVDNYFNNVSNGRVRVRGDVFPVGLDDAYKLPHEMRYYNPNTSTEDTDRGIAKLFVDAVITADNDTSFNYADYDLVVIFHAGVGRDISLDFDETPQDIPSLYITRQFIAQNLDTVFNGLAVDNGNWMVDKAILLPETENQQGIQLAMTGLFAANIGSYLGLYDLYSTEEQRSGIGKLGLMDAGLFNANGLIPAPPSAFSRKILGWETPYILNEPSTEINIARFKSANTDGLPTIIEIPVNEDESFLLEYRGNHQDNLDSVLYEIADQRDEFPGYMEILKTNYRDRIEISPNGVLLSVDDYDLGMPGNGILLWHIDNAAIRNAEDRQINNNPLWRAVDVEEADGSEDIGENYNFLQAGYQSDLGWRFDYWHANNDAPLFKNVFSGSSSPNSRSNLNRTETNIVISNFSNYFSDVMTFDYTRDFYDEGFPIKINNADATDTKVISGPVKKNDRVETFVFSINDQGHIYGFGAAGQGLFASEKTMIQNISASFGDLISIALMDTNQVADGINDILIALSSNALYGFDLGNSDPDTMAIVMFEQNAGITAATNSPIVVHNRLIYFIDGALIQSYGYDGEPSPPIEPVNAPFLYDLVIDDSLNLPINPYAGYNYLAGISPEDLLGLRLTENGSEFSSYTMADEQENILFTADSAIGQFSLMDIDGNGTVDILYNSSNGLHVYNQNGSPVINFPIFPRLSEKETLIGTPMIIGLNGSEDPLIIITTSKGQILAYNKSGKNAPGFPISLGGDFSHQVLPVQWDDDSAFELVGVSNKGFISALEIMGTNSNSALIWTNTNLNEHNNAIFKKQFTPVAKLHGLVPASLFFNYPNPNQGNFTTIRYYLNEAARVSFRIFDISGYKIDEFSGPGLANTANEVLWNVKDVSSGVYICQLEAKTASASQRRIIKIMIVH